MGLCQDKGKRPLGEGQLIVGRGQGSTRVARGRGGLSRFIGVSVMVTFSSCRYGEGLGLPGVDHPGCRPASLVPGQVLPPPESGVTPPLHHLLGPFFQQTPASAGAAGSVRRSEATRLLRSRVSRPDGVILRSAELPSRRICVSMES